MPLFESAKNFKRFDTKSRYQIMYFRLTPKISVKHNRLYDHKKLQTSADNNYMSEIAALNPCY